MGLDFLRDKEKKFKQRRDQSKARELNTEDLITRSKPDYVAKHYHCRLTDEKAEIVPGLGLIARVVSPTSVIILQHGRQIGHVLIEEVSELVIAMHKNSHLGGFLSLTIVEAPAFDGIFVVKPKVAFKK